MVEPRLWLEEPPELLEQAERPRSRVGQEPTVRMAQPEEQPVILLEPLEPLQLEQPEQEEPLLLQQRLEAQQPRLPVSVELEELLLLQQVQVGLLLMRAVVMPAQVELQVWFPELVEPQLARARRLVEQEGLHRLQPELVEPRLERLSLELVVRLTSLLALAARKPEPAMLLVALVELPA